PSPAAGGPWNLSCLQLPSRRGRSSALSGLGRNHRDPRPTLRNRLVGEAPRSNHAHRFGSRRAALSRLAPFERRLLTSQGPDDHGPPRSPGNRPPATRRIPALRAPGGGGRRTLPAVARRTPSPAAPA